MSRSRTSTGATLLIAALALAGCDEVTGPAPAATFTITAPQPGDTLRLGEPFRLAFQATIEEPIRWVPVTLSPALLDPISHPDGLPSDLPNLLTASYRFVSARPTTSFNVDTALVVPDSLLPSSEAEGYRFLFAPSGGMVETEDYARVPVVLVAGGG